MRFVLALISLLAIVGTSLAIDSVEIKSPVENNKFNIGEKIPIKVNYVDKDGNCEYKARFFINGIPSSSKFIPTAPGFYTLKVVVVDYYDGTEIFDDVTIEVVEPEIRP